MSVGIHVHFPDFINLCNSYFPSCFAMIVFNVERFLFIISYHVNKSRAVMY